MLHINIELAEQFPEKQKSVCACVCVAIFINVTCSAHAICVGMFLHWRNKKKTIQNSKQLIYVEC